MRKYLRALARVNMEKQGIKQINKPVKGSKYSKFALNWRRFVKV